MFRTGIGYDVHRLQEGLPLWLGGINVPHSKGLVGHSDADVLLHGDIGQHFPDTDPTYKGIDSKLLLGKVCTLVRQHGYDVANVDSILCLQQPKVANYIPLMRKTIAATMDLPIDTVSVKATTTERLGFEGREEGVSAWASVLIEKRS